MTFLVTGEDGFLGTPRAAVEAALIEAAKDVSDVVSLSRKNLTGAHPTIVYRQCPNRCQSVRSF
jgi:hypothetical protein